MVGWASAGATLVVVSEGLLPDSFDRVVDSAEGVLGALVGAEATSADCEDASGAEEAVETVVEGSDAWREHGDRVRTSQKRKRARRERT